MVIINKFTHSFRACDVADDAIDVSLCDRQVVSAFKDQVLDGLELINKSFHSGIHKVWIL